MVKITIQILNKHVRSKHKKFMKYESKYESMFIFRLPNGW